MTELEKSLENININEHFPGGEDDKREENLNLCEPAHRNSTGSYFFFCYKIRMISNFELIIFEPKNYFDIVFLYY